MRLLRQDLRHRDFFAARRKKYLSKISELLKKMKKVKKII